MTTPPATSGQIPSRAGWLGPIVIAAIVGLAYANSFQGVFVFDDLGSIRDNPTIRTLAASFFPPSGGLTVGGRPLLNFSFAVNHAVGGESAWGFHAVNLGIHILASLALFGLVRRTLRLPTVSARYREDADWLALAVTLLWALHPLQTESVTYLVQRAESLAGLFYLLTLYCFVRGVAPGALPRWLDAAIAAGLLGALTKETIATAPLVIVLYDRIFVSRSFAEGWDRHRGVYFGLALSWLVVWWQVIGTGGRGGTAGFDTPVTWWSYGLKQFQAIARYLQLTFWPQGLVIDYGTSVDLTGGQLATGVAVVVGLLAATAIAFRRHPALGFLGAWFLLNLAPSSSIIPVATQVMAEHRMYLALAAVVALVVLALHAWLGSPARWVCVMLAVVCGLLTAQRNRDYSSWIVLWSQAVTYGENNRAHLNLGQALAEAGRPAEAIEHYAAALKLQPHNPAAHNNWANALVDLNRPDEAISHYEEALRLHPNYAEAHFNYGNTLALLGRQADAATHYQAAVHQAPTHAKAHYGLALALTRLGRLDEAVTNYQAAARLAPKNAEVPFRLGNVLMQLQRPGEAVDAYEASLRLDPQNADAARNLAAARQAVGNH
jgi:Flp pilus assembly protein TadD